MARLHHELEHGHRLRERLNRCHLVVTFGGEILAASAGAIVLHADGRRFTSRDGTLARVDSGRRVSGTQSPPNLVAFARLAMVVGAR